MGVPQFTGIWRCGIILPGIWLLHWVGGGVLPLDEHRLFIPLGLQAARSAFSLVKQNAGSRYEVFCVAKSAQRRFFVTACLCRVKAAPRIRAASKSSQTRGAQGSNGNKLSLVFYCK